MKIYKILTLITLKEQGQYKNDKISIKKRYEHLIINLKINIFKK